MQSDTVMTQLDELELEKGEDAPMSMAAIPETKTIICGINSSEDSLKDGLNQNCRKFTIESDKYVPFTLVAHMSLSTRFDLGSRFKQVRAL